MAYQGGVFTEYRTRNSKLLYLEFVPVRKSKLSSVKCIFILLQPVPIQMSTSQGTTCGGISDSTVFFNLLFFFLFFISSFFFSELSGTTPKNGFSPRLSPDGPAIAGRLDSSWQTVLCAPLFAQGWATCSSAEHGGWSSPPVCEPRQQACCRDRVVAERPRLDFANSLGGVAPPPFCSD